MSVTMPFPSSMVLGRLAPSSSDGVRRIPSGAARQSTLVADRQAGRHLDGAGGGEEGPVVARNARYEVVDPEQSADLEGHGPPEDARAGPGLQHAPVSDDHDLVREHRRLLRIVGHEHGRQPRLALQAAQLPPQLVAHRGVQAPRTARRGARSVGSRASARARLTRWRCPPESCSG